MLAHLQVVPSEKIHPQLFKGANRRFKNIPWSKLERRRHDKELTPEEFAKRVARAIKKDKIRQKKIAAAGIDYEYTPLQATAPQKPKKMTFE
jgi:nucleolar protein 15